MSIEAANIVWVHGPFPCGTWPDIKISKSRLASVLPRNEMKVADSGYQHQKCISPSNVSCEQRAIHARIRARHESCNAQLKYFNILQDEFGHNFKKHGTVFHAVAKLVVFMIRYKECKMTSLMYTLH